MTTSSDQPKQLTPGKPYPKPEKKAKKSKATKKA